MTTHYCFGPANHEHATVDEAIECRAEQEYGGSCPWNEYSIDFDGSPAAWAEFTAHRDSGECPVCSASIDRRAT